MNGGRKKAKQEQQGRVKKAERESEGRRETERVLGERTNGWGLRRLKARENSGWRTYEREVTAET